MPQARAGYVFTSIRQYRTLRGGSANPHVVPAWVPHAVRIDTISFTKCRCSEFSYVLATPRRAAERALMP
ncbi:MAG TPA: hypothetical protein VMU75_12605 [Acidimicrobiales bacterium]|nr:hypothetical protein [Acidimicrobiales bacterium]